MNKLFLIMAMGCGLFLAGCAPEQENSEISATAAQKVQIEGSFLYRERIALPPHSYATITLNNVTNDDLPAEPLTAQKIDMNGQSVPVGYLLVAENIALNPDMRYGINIDIRAPNDEKLFETSTPHMIDSSQNAQRLEPIILTQATPQDDASDMPGQSPFIGMTWVAQDVNQQGMIDNTNISFVFTDEERVGGFAGCNNFNMPFEDNNGVLEMGSAAVTMKACPPAISQQERKFLVIFSELKTYMFDDTNALILKTQDGRSITARHDGS